MAPSPLRMGVCSIQGRKRGGRQRVTYGWSGVPWGPHEAWNARVTLGDREAGL